MARTWGYAIALVVVISTLVATSVLIGVELSRPKIPASVAPTGVVWDDRTFLSKAALRRWLRSRGVDYPQWARHHAAAVAALEHLPAPLSQQSPVTPVGVRRSHLSFFSGLWLVACLALGTALLSRDERPHRTRLSRKRRRQVADWIERAHPQDTAQGSPNEHSSEALDASEPVSPELVLVSHLRAAEIAALPAAAPVRPSPEPGARPDVEQRPAIDPHAEDAS
jgi:hypothetical protein